MDATHHGMSDLFAQLGLPADPEAIQAFIEAHRPLPTGRALSDAPFWTSAQAAFLRDQVDTDADWAGIIDRLDSAFRRPRS